MANYNVGTVETTLHATDSRALLDPQVLDRIAQVVMRKMREAREHESRAADERALRPAASAEPTTNWG